MCKISPEVIEPQSTVTYWLWTLIRLPTSYWICYFAPIKSWCHLFKRKTEKKIWWSDNSEVDISIVFPFLLTQVLLCYLGIKKRNPRYLHNFKLWYYYIIPKKSKIFTHQIMILLYKTIFWLITGSIWMQLIHQLTFQNNHYRYCVKRIWCVYNIYSWI